MLLSRPLTRRLRRLTACRAILLLALLLLVDSLFLLAQRPPAASVHDSRSARGISSSSFRSVFIASIHRDTAPLLHRSWSKTLVELVERLGPDNVHVSIVESGSHDATRTELRQLETKLNRRGVTNTVRHDLAGWELADDIRNKPARGEHRPGWIWHRNGTRPEMRRIPHLAHNRNLAMEPLMTLAAEGRVFDRVLWIDDVVFRSQDAIDVLETRNGEYAAACSLDVGGSPRLLDTTVLRDDHGQPPVSSFWPWFLSPTAVSAIQSGLPTRVYSCWNGLVAFQAAPFYADPPLQFRSVPDSLAQRRIEGSERCLVHADNPLSASQGVWLNPRVRVGHRMASRATLLRSNTRRYPSWAGTLLGSWMNRIVRWRGDAQTVMDNESTVRSRLRDWDAETHEPLNKPDIEVGLPCLMDHMQVLRPEGWANI